MNVRTLIDESENKLLTKALTDRIYQDMNRLRIREKAKFKERTGIEFEGWTRSLEDDFPSSVVREIVNDDDFWNATLAVSRL